MDKLTLAHEWAMNSFCAAFENEEERAKLAWQYADAMLAEAEKREDKSRPDVLADVWHEKALEDAKNYGVGFVRISLKDGQFFKERLDPKLIKLSYAEINEDWQPDWSQAPKHMNYYFMNKDGQQYWAVNKPDEPNFTEHVVDFRDCGGDCYAYASSQDYKGDWRQSLRKRPR